MSSSYPQDNAEKDFRLMAKAIKSNLDTKGKMETTVQVQEKQLWYQSITNKLKTILIGDQEIRDVDEIDGRTEEILQPIVKLYFLKILLLDIGISFGDLVTDVAQGMNLIFDSNWNIHWSTFHYGCVVLAIIWLPVIPMLLHIATTKGLKKYFGDEESL